MATRKRTRSRWTASNLCTLITQGTDGSEDHPIYVPTVTSRTNFASYGIVESITDEDRKVNYRYGYDTTSKDRGGPMTLQRVEHFNYPSTFRGARYLYWPSGNPRGSVTVSGGLITNDWGLINPVTGRPNPTGWDSAAGLPKPSDFLETASKGPTGFRKFSPVKPQANTSQLLGELLHSIPTIPGLLLSRLFSLRNVGREHLNVEFGWAPLLKDIQDLIKVTLEFEKRYKQLVKQSGVPVRRRGQIDVDNPLSTNTVTKGSHHSVPTLNGYLYEFATAPETKTTSFTSSKKHLFSAKFVYFLPASSKDGIDDRHRAAMLRILYGIDLSPRTVWNLMPWSWLVDWFTNIGDNISNAVEASLDNLVAEYAYCTGFYQDVMDVTVSGVCKVDNQLGGLRQQYYPYTTRYRRIRTVIERTKASPYGFEFTIPTLSEKRKAILAALLLTRSRA